MFRSLRSATGQIALALAVMLGTLVPSSAKAADVTVGGITYDVVFFQGPATFNDNSATIEAAPWWGSAANALTFANAYAAQVTPFPFDLSGNIDFLAFAYANDGVNTSQAELTDLGTTGDFSVPDAFGTNDLHYAYVNVAAPVPEIDGGALGQGAVILLAVWLVMRRRRGLAA